MIRPGAASETFRGTSRFAIRRRLGAGGMGIVYLANDRERGHDVALKVLASVDAAEIYRFKQEFRLLTGMSHENLVELYELIAEGDQWFFTMEYVEGVDFLRYVHGGVAPASETSQVLVRAARTRPDRGDGATALMERPLDAAYTADTVAVLHDAPAAPARRGFEPHALDLGRLNHALPQLVRGVAAVHAAGLLHLDIKPSNVLVTPGGRVVVLDFGLVADLRPKRHDRSDDARPIGGTPAYMAPEQGAGAAVTEAADWYGVGALLYEVLTGSLPFAGSVREILQAKATREPPPPDAIRRRHPDLPVGLDTLCVDLLRREPERRPRAREILSRLGVDTAAMGVAHRLRGSDAVQLMGRERELAALHDAFEASKRGVAVTVAVHGPSGMGKSAVIDRFLDEIAEDGEALVLAGRCYERESVPYKAFDSLIDVLARRLQRASPLRELQPSQLAALGRLFPVLGQVPMIEAALRDSPVSPDAQELRRQAFAALRELLDRLATLRPVVLYIDDVQWGDLDSATLLSAILRSPDPPRLLVVASYRDEDLRTSPFLLAMRRELEKGALGVPREIAIAPLTFDQARALALQVLPEADPAREAKAETVARESAGHPYFVTELASYMRAREVVGEDASLDEMIWGRVLALPPEARPLLDVVAVAGRPISSVLAQRALSAVAPSHTGSEDHAVNVLQARSMIRTSGARGTGAIETFHDRVRETVVHRLSRERLRECHAGLAAALEGAASIDAEQLVEHFEGAEKPEKAGSYAVVAADAAARALAFDRAAMLYEKAIRFLPADAKIQELRERLADALANAGRGADAGRAYLAASAQASGLRALDLRRRAAEQFLISGHTDAGTNALRSVVDAVGIPIARSPARALASILARRALLRVRGLGYRERAPQSLPEDVIAKIDVCWAAAVGLSMIDNVRGADFQGRHLLLALRAGEPARVARAIAFEIAFLSSGGSAAQAATAKVARRAGKIAAQVDTPYSRAFFALMEGAADYLAGRFRSGLARCEAAEVDLREHCSGVEWELATAQRFSLGSLMYMGRLGELSRRAPALLRRAEDRGNLYSATDLRTRFTLTWLAADDPARAGAEVEDALRSWSHDGFHLQHYNSLLALVQRDLYVGDAAAAWRRLEERWRALKGSMLLRVQLLRAEVIHLRARAALANAERGLDARRWFALAEKDAARIERERAAWADPLALLVRAAIAVARDRVQEAAKLAGAAARGFAGADMALHAAVARRRSGEILGGDEGASLVRAADEWMRGEGVVAPERIAALLAPGRWSH